MKIEDIQKLIEYIIQCNLDEINIVTETLKLNIKKHGHHLVETPVLLHHNTVPLPTGTNPISTTTPVQSVYNTTNTSQANVTTNQVEIKSPMIGTFYRATSPDTPPFVSVGDEVKAGQVICIIEAMKLFNEIEAEVAGKITQIRVDDASPVEYDQPLFIIETI